MLETGGWGATSEGARKAFAAAKEKLAKAGVELKGRADDPDIEAVEKAIADAQPLTLAINAWEGRWPLNTYVDLDASKLSQGARDRLKVAEATTQKQYGELLARRAAAREAYAKVAGRYDAFVTLGACGAAPIGLGSTGNTAMNVAASLLGCPALTLPLLHDEGLPLGLQLLGAHRPRRRAVRRGELGGARRVRPRGSGRRGLNGYAFHKLLNCVATTSSYLPTPLVRPTVCTNLHMLVERALGDRRVVVRQVALDQLRDQARLVCREPLLARPWWRASDRP